MIFILQVFIAVCNAGKVCFPSGLELTWKFDTQRIRFVYTIPDEEFLTKTYAGVGFGYADYREPIIDLSSIFIHKNQKSDIFDALTFDLALNPLDFGLGGTDNIEDYSDVVDETVRVFSWTKPLQTDETSCDVAYTEGEEYRLYYGIVKLQPAGIFTGQHLVDYYKNIILDDSEYDCEISIVL